MCIENDKPRRTSEAMTSSRSCCSGALAAVGARAMDAHKPEANAAVLAALAFAARCLHPRKSRTMLVPATTWR